MKLSGEDLSCYHHHNCFTALFPDPGEPMPEENFWTLWCKGRLTEADTPTNLSCYLNKIESAGLRKCPYYCYFTKKPMSQ